MGKDIEPVDFIEELDSVEEEIARRRGTRSKAWRYLTLRVPLIAALLYLSANLDRFYLWVGIIFFAAVADLLFALRRERLLELKRDALLARLEGERDGGEAG
jgi:fatty acid desaturase